MILQQDDQIANKYWNSVNNQKKEYVGLDSIQEWVAKVLKQKKLLTKFTEQVDVSELLKQYLKGQCQLDDNKQGIQFKFEEALSFLNWVLQQKLPNEKQKQQQPEQNNQEDEQKTGENGAADINDEQKQQQNSKNSQDPNQQLQKQQAQQQNSSHPENGQNSSVKNELSAHRVESDFRAEEFQQKENQFDGQKENKPRKFSQDHQNNNNNQVSLHRDAYSQTKLKNYDAKEKKVYMDEIKQIDPNKVKNLNKHHLQIIFEHYCKLSYAMGQDPTFDQIQHKSQTMTVNKFMMFCRDFNLISRQTLSRTTLVDLFKKYSSHSKEMNFQQFQIVLEKIGTELKQKLGTSQHQSEKQEIPGQYQPNLIFLLKFMEIQSSIAFKQKMKKLNIQLRAKGDVQPMKKQPTNYKFKFTPANGKTQEQIKQEIQQRKNVRSEKKLVAREKILSNKGIFDKQPKVKTLKQTPLVAPKKLLPPTPPLKLSKINNSTNLSSNIQGYANIHRLKQNKTKIDTANSRQRFKLNSIVQEAKKIINEGDIDSSEPQMSHYKKRTQSEYSNKYSLYQSQRDATSTPMVGTQYDDQAYFNYSKNYESRRSSQVDNIKMTKFQNKHGHLAHLLEGDDDDDDFLKQHLQRQKKNSLINKRLEKKIEALNQ